MTVHDARVIALAVVLVGISALVPSTRLHAQQPLDQLRARVEQGDAEAQTTLGDKYFVGSEVPEDVAEAVRWYPVRWYRFAANQGHATAQTALGLLYDDGEGVPQDDTEAVELLERTEP